jgi:hypothetical protein
MEARGLTPEERASALDALRKCGVADDPVCVRAVDEAILVPTLPKLSRVRGPRSAIAHIALAARASGITLGRRIYIRSELFGADGSLDRWLVVHEVAHVVQYLRDGHARFLTRYLAEYAAGMARGLKDYDAYLAISYEVEARRVDAEAR